MMEPKYSTSLQIKSSPRWESLDLVAHFLDHKSLATAVCVCKSWAISMSSDHLWQPFFSAHYPSLANLTNAAKSTAVSYHKLYSLGHAAEKRRLQPPPKPDLSLQHLIFSIDIRNPGESILSVVKPGGEVKLDKDGCIFRFDIDVEAEKWVGLEALENGLKITWNVVLEGFRSVFTMMDCEGKGRCVMGLEGWFSKELPACSGGGAASGLVVDLRVGLRQSGGKVVVERMSLGVLSIVSWRYVGVDEVLRYLQHFLLPSNMHVPQTV